MEFPFQILKYKKRKLAERHLELTKLYQYIANILPTLKPALNLSSSLRSLRLTPFGQRLRSGGSFPLKIPHTSAALKAVEDRPDSLICAYVAAHWWYWGLQRNWVLGDRTTGYIVVRAQLRV